MNCASFLHGFIPPHCPASVIYIYANIFIRASVHIFLRMLYCSRCKSHPAVEDDDAVVTNQLPSGFAVNILAGIINRLGEAPKLASVLGALGIWCGIAKGGNGFTTGTDIILPPVLPSFLPSFRPSFLPSFLPSCFLLPSGMLRRELVVARGVGHGVGGPVRVEEREREKKC